ncbi:hypothetical protein B4135_0342 [Caldibacillus debilis]|uniref:Uncharacterized protein n=1 Tax=Caldibacillus debilis TaxID=301148 RepID=A0A150M4H5_9BACI|nr:hypothetical protein B4135_0342 [Caldibacillus debilis]
MPDAGGSPIPEAGAAIAGILRPSFKDRTIRICGEDKRRGNRPLPVVRAGKRAGKDRAGRTRRRERERPEALEIAGRKKTDWQGWGNQTYGREKRKGRTLP